MKRANIALLVLALALASGCGPKDKETGAVSSSTTQQATAETTKEAETSDEAGKDKARDPSAEEGSFGDGHEMNLFEESTTEETTAASQVLGDEANHNISYPVKNSTGLTIIGIYIKENGEADFGPENLVDEPFPDGEVRDAFFNVDENKEYDIRINYENGTVDEITHFDMRNISEAEVIYKDGKTIILMNGQDDVTPTPEPTTTKKKPTKATSDPNDGCIGDDGLFY